MRYKIASDLDRDGMGLEVEDSQGNVLFEIFHNDEDGSLKLNTLQNSIDLGMVSEAIAIAKIRLTPKRKSLSDKSEREKFVSDIKAIAEDIGVDIENADTKSFILSVANWLEDCDGYYKNMNVEMNINSPSWKLFRDAFNAGLIYE